MSFISEGERKIVQNREKQFEALYEAHYQMVYNICYSYLRLSDETEDIMQESFMDFYQANKLFASAEQEKYYLIRIVINNCKTHLKKKKRIIMVDVDEIEYMKANDKKDDISVFDIISILEPKYKETIV